MILRWFFCSFSAHLTPHEPSTRERSTASPTWRASRSPSARSRSTRRACRASSSSSAQLERADTSRCRARWRIRCPGCRSGCGRTWSPRGPARAVPGERAAGGRGPVSGAQGHRMSARADTHEYADAAGRGAARAREFSSVELTRACLARIEQHQSALNAFITRDRASAALAEARARRRAARGRRAAVRSPACRSRTRTSSAPQGVRTTCGSRMLDNFVSPYDATVVSEAASAAGTVMLGKTNMDEFAMGSSNETSYYGPVRNPWDRDAGAGRLLGRLGGGGGRAPGAGGHRHRYRRLDPPARGAVRHHRASSPPTAACRATA